MRLQAVGLTYADRAASLQRNRAAILSSLRDLLRGNWEDVPALKRWAIVGEEEAGKSAIIARRSARSTFALGYFRWEDAVTGAVALQGAAICNRRMNLRRRFGKRWRLAQAPLQRNGKKRMTSISMGPGSSPA